MVILFEPSTKRKTRSDSFRECIFHLLPLRRYEASREASSTPPSLQGVVDCPANPGATSLVLPRRVFKCETDWPADVGHVARRASNRNEEKRSGSRMLDLDGFRPISISNCSCSERAWNHCAARKKEVALFMRSETFKANLKSADRSNDAPSKSVEPGL